MVVRMIAPSSFIPMVIERPKDVPGEVDHPGCLSLRISTRVTTVFDYVQRSLYQTKVVILTGFRCDGVRGLKVIKIQPTTIPNQPKYLV